MATNNPRIIFRCEQHEKDDFAELADIRGTTVTLMLRTFVQKELSSLPRERRIAQGLPVEAGDDFLN